MKEFFLILFFAEAIALTDEPIDISDRVSFNLAKPISAITSGAHVRIDVTKSLAGTVDFSSIVSVLESLKMQFPNGSVTAVLTTSNGEETILDQVSGSTIGEDAELILSSSSGVPTGVEFYKLEINSSRKLVGVTVVWQNHYK